MTDVQTDGTGSSPPPATPVRANVSTSEDRHRTHEKIYWVVYIVLVVATLVATVIAACYAAGAYHQARRQADIAQDALIESDHPFLDVRLSSRDPMIDGDKMFPQVHVEIVNDGSKAAMVDFIQFSIATDAHETLSSFKLDCAELFERRIVAPAGSLSADCLSKTAFPVSGTAPIVFTGVFTYRNQFGTRWRQSIAYAKRVSGDWQMTGDTDFNKEVRIGPDGEEIKKDQSE